MKAKGMEKRNFTRVRVRTLAVVKGQLTEIKGEVEDLSLKGVRLKTSPKLDLDTDVQIKIFFKNGFSKLWVEISGIVTRNEDNGMVIQFTRMSLDSYIHLRNVISNLLDDQSKVFDEFFLHMTNGSAKGPCAELHFQESFNDAVDQQMVPQS